MAPFDSQFLHAVILIAAPLILVALGELLSETAGVMNIGLQGTMLLGAFVSFWAAGAAGNPWVGIVAGIGAGLGLSLFMGLATVELRANQIVVGVAINLLGGAISLFLFQRYTDAGGALLIDRMTSARVPLLHRLPIVGDAFFEQIPPVYVALALVPIVTIVFYKTRWGLQMRAAGDVPEAIETIGVTVRRRRWQGVMIAGALAGLGGAFLSVGLVGTFLPAMTGGRGFIALAAVIVGGWRPIGVFGAALLFAAAEALQLRLQSESYVPRMVWILLAILALGFIVHRIANQRRAQVRGEVGATPLKSEMVGALVVMACAGMLALALPHVTLPSVLWLAVPYVLTILVLGGLAGKSNAPSTLGVAYERGA